MQLICEIEEEWNIFHEVYERLDDDYLQLHLLFMYTNWIFTETHYTSYILDLN